MSEKYVKWQILSGNYGPTLVELQFLQVSSRAGDGDGLS